MQLTVFFVACLLGGALGKTYGPGQICTRCNQARDSEDVCNNQDIEGGNEVWCKENEVCTTDVRCDGQGRLFFIKGCEKAAKISAVNTLICNDDFTRCNYHCDQRDFCNLNAPPAVWESLVCYDEVTTTQTVTTPTVTTPACPGGSTVTSTEDCDCSCSCELDVCPVVCTQTHLDVIFLVDTSGSIGSNNFNTMKLFVADVIDNLNIGPDMTHVGIIRFDGSQYLDLTLGDPDDPKTVALAMAFNSGGSTDIPAAISAMDAMFTAHADPANIPVGILLTDGHSSTSGSATAIATANANHPNLLMIAVGVGTGVNNAELQLIATGDVDTDGNHPNVFDVTDFQGLQDIVDALTLAICA